MDMEQLLQDYFNCSKPFKKNGELSVNGTKAYGKLLDMLYALNNLGVIDSKTTNNAIKEIDKILDTNY